VVGDSRVHECVDHCRDHLAAVGVVVVELDHPLALVGASLLAKRSDKSKLF
jgi:hypothetical protein